LINDILDLSKVEAGKMELELSGVDLRGILNNCMFVFMEKTVEDGIELNMHIDGIPETIQADDRKLKQIMFNLLSNAVKFTPGGGSITVTAHGFSCSNGLLTTGDGREIVLSAKDDGDANDPRDYVQISVEDQGIGIKRQDLARIFDPFEQVEVGMSRRYRGTGLGLSLTRTLVELHRGTIWAESEGEGKGSVFRFILPVGSDEAAEGR
jgi:signal transduction histidine kinase